MNYISFEKSLKNFVVFSVHDIKKRFPDFDNRRLVEWQHKGYIIKIKRGFYCFSEAKKDEYFQYFSANKLYAPSYISLETALSYYSLIPEGVFLTTSITTLNTAKYNTLVGNYDYKHIKSSLFFGYKLIQERGLTFKIAEAEKTILDYLYLKAVNTIDDLQELRFNKFQVEAVINLEKLEKYQRIFNSKVLFKRVAMFKKLMYA